jgi:hypothetical protein
MISEQDLAKARDIRQHVGPLRDPDGRLRASTVALESSLRERYGLPSYIIELDGPQNGRDHMEGQNQAQDRLRDPGDTMPAQGWLDQTTDAGRLPAPREDSTMARPITDTGTDRQDFDSAAQRASTVAQFAMMAEGDRDRELSARSLDDLRELSDTARRTAEWHRLGVENAELIQRYIGGLLRHAADQIDPQAVAMTSVERSR